MHWDADHQSATPRSEPNERSRSVDRERSLGSTAAELETAGPATHRPEFEMCSKAP